MKNLLFEAILKVSLGILLVVSLIFLPAGTIYYFNGWLLITILFVPMFIAGIIMYKKNPELLRKRLKSKEKENGQSTLIKLSGFMFILGFIIAGLNFRFSWYILPKSVSIIAAVLFLLGYALYAEVLKENVYLSRIIEVSKEQKVIDTGLYSIIRHPMYTATLLLFLSMPLILGSIFSFIVFLVYPFIIVSRLKKEEDFLKQNLEGYNKYMQKVRYRLIPFIY